jgi:hypothetical protein
MVEAGKVPLPTSSHGMLFSYKNAILPFAGKWMQLESIVLSEISKLKRQRLHVFTHLWNPDLK